MDISSILEPSQIIPNLRASCKNDVIDELLMLSRQSGKINDYDAFRAAILERERIQTTALGHGLALPHAVSDAVSSTVLVMGISRSGVDFNALDGELSYVIFLLGAPVSQGREHLAILASISRLFRQRSLVPALCKAKNSSEVYVELVKASIISESGGTGEK